MTRRTKSTSTSGMVCDAETVQQDVFIGTPFCGKPSEKWNQAQGWEDAYAKIAIEKDRGDHVMEIFREADLLVPALEKIGELPRSTPKTILDAGCGVALIPHILALWGFKVTAIDFSEKAIEIASQLQPSEEDLAKCVPFWEIDRKDGYTRLVTDKSRLLRRLRTFKAQGGSVSFAACDWLSDNLRPGSYELIYCRNGLHFSTKPYWRRSLKRFHQLLAPGGCLLLENINAIGILPEVRTLLDECDFVPLKKGAVREPSRKFVFSMWPTG